MSLMGASRTNAPMSTQPSSAVQAINHEALRRASHVVVLVPAGVASIGTCYELAQAIQEGLQAKASGDERTATTKLGRAAQLAAETGNAEATAKLRKVVDIDNAETGTVRLKRGVAKADEMALDTASTKTTRIRG